MTAQTTTKSTTNAKIGVLVASIILIVCIGGGFLFLSYAERHSKTEAINTVRNYEIAEFEMTVNDMVRANWSYPYKAVWGAEHEAGSQYLVTLQIVMELSEENVYCDNARWQVDIGAKKIEPLDDSARIYMGL